MDEQQFHDLIGEALAALSRQDAVRAMAIADQLLADCPDHALARAVRAQALLDSTGPESGVEALGEAQRAVELAPKSEYPRVLLGIAAWRSGRLSQAQDSYEQAIRLSGGDPWLLAEYAWFMANERGPRLGEEAARQAISVHAESSTAWAALGVAQHRLRRLKDAERSLCQALRCDPNDVRAQSALIVLLQGRGRDDQVLALARLLDGIPGTEEFIESVRREARGRQMNRLLIERGIASDQVEREQKRRAWLGWIAISAFVFAGLLLLLLRGKPNGAWLLILVPPIVRMALKWRSDE